MLKLKISPAMNENAYEGTRGAVNRTVGVDLPSKTNTKEIRRWGNANDTVGNSIA